MFKIYFKGINLKKMLIFVLQKIECNVNMYNIFFVIFFKIINGFCKGLLMFCILRLEIDFSFIYLFNIL